MANELYAQICYTSQTAGTPCPCDNETSSGQNVCMYAGDVLTISVIAHDCNGDAMDITGYTFRWALQTPDATLIKTTGSGITLVTPASGLISIALVAADTVGLTTGIYSHQLEATNGSSEKTIAMSGSIQIQDNIFP